jgi:KDO2-lipid IV(A) lauroyltransferase
MIMSSFSKKISSASGYFVIRILQLFLRTLSAHRISDLGAFNGALFERLGIRKQTALDNIRKSNLNMAVPLALETISKSYRNLGRTFFELLALDRIRLIEGRDYGLVLPENLSKQIKNGAIFVSAHVGNWELMGKILAEKKIPLAVVVKRQYNEKVDRLIYEQRQAAGMKVVYDDETVKLLRLIKNKYCVALLSDQDFGDNTVPVNFLGRTCFAPEGPVFLARKFHIPIFMCFAIRQGCYFHRFEIRSFEVDLSMSNKELVQVFTNEIEKTVKIHPEQWFWHHRRWKVHA